MAAAEAILAAADAIVHVAEASGILELVGYWLRYSIGMNLGWLKNAVIEALGRITGVNEAEPSIGVPVTKAYDVALQMIGDAIRHQAVSGAPVLHHILSAVYGTAYEPVGRYLRSVVEAALRSRTVTELPHAFDLIWAGEQLEYMDADSLAWLMIVSGAHPAHIVYNVLQSVKWLYEMHLNELRSDVDSLARRFNDVMLMDVDVLDNEVRYWIGEALRTYHRAVNRLLSIVDHIGERTLVRIWEIRLAAKTVLTYYMAGLVDYKTAAKALVRLDEETELAYKAFLDAMSIVEEVYNSMNFEDEISKVINAIDTYKRVMGSWLASQVGNLLAWEGAREAMKKIDEALWKMLIAKHRVDFENAIKPVAKFWRTEYAVKPGTLKIDKLEGV